MNIEKYRQILFDRLPIWYLFWNMVVLGERPEKVELLPSINRIPNYSLAFLTRIRIKIRQTAMRFLANLFPTVEFNCLKIDDYLEANRLGMDASVPGMEIIYGEWKKRHNIMYNNVSNYFFNNEDIHLAQKKYLCMILENIYSLYYLAREKSSLNPSLLILSARDSYYFIDFSLKKHLLEPDKNLHIAQTNALFRKLSHFSQCIWGSIFNLLFSIRYLTRWLKSTRKTVPHFDHTRKYSVAIRNLFGTSLGTPNKPKNLYWRDMAFLIDGENIKKKDLLILGNLVNKTGQVNHEEQYLNAGLDFVNFSKMKMSFNCFFGKIVSRFPRLLLHYFYGLFGFERSLFSSITPKMLDPFSRWLTLHDNAQFHSFADIDEHSFDHIIYTIVSEYYGTHSVFLPHGTLQRLFHQKACFGYSLALIPGKHLVESYGKTWKQDMRLFTVGNMKNDAAAAFGTGDIINSSPAFEKKMASLKQSGCKIISFFPSLIYGYMEERQKCFFELVRKIGQRWPNEKLIIKSKYGADYPKVFFDGVGKEIMDKMIDQDQLLFIDCQDEIKCSVQSLAQLSDVNISISSKYQSVSSSWVETVLLGVVSFAYDPLVQSMTTPGVEPFINHLIFQDDEDLLSAIEQVFAGKYDNPKMTLFKDYFDPYADEKTLPRIRKVFADLANNSEQFFTECKTVQQELKN